MPRCPPCLLALLPLAATPGAALAPDGGTSDCSLVDEPQAWRVWSREKQVACCLQEYACSAGWSPEEGPPPRDCRSNFDFSGTPGTDWCCLVCPMPLALLSDQADAGYDCAGGMWIFWDQGKKDFCCKTRGLGCQVVSPEDTMPPPMEYHDCGVGKKTQGKPEHWIAAKRLWCCQEWGVGCSPGADRSCEAVFLEAPNEWVPARQAYCCVHGSPEVRQRLADESVCQVDWPTAKVANLDPTAQPEEAPSGGVVDCNNLNGAPGIKRTFCCKFYHVGCGPSSAEEGAAPAAGLQAAQGTPTALRASSPKRQPPPQQQQRHGQHQPEDEEEELDCTKDAGQWQTAWSVDRIRWCCQHRGRACTSAWEPSSTQGAALDAGDVAPAEKSEDEECAAAISSGMPSTDATRAVATGCCDGWKGTNGYPVLGRAFCCLLDEACAATLEAASCQEVPAMDSMRREWCCAHEKVGCDETMLALPFLSSS